MSVGSTAPATRRSSSVAILPNLIAGFPTPFVADWDNLDLEQLQTFFAEADDEGWTWEAKGTVAKAEHVRVAASAFGNSVEGGFLVIGARRETQGGPWILDGVELNTEPKLWVTTALMNDGVRPVPSYDSRAFELGNGRIVVVVNVRPVAVPPVITNKGQVWERLSSVSRQVTDPASLRRLVERGERALAEAARVTDEAIGGFLGDPTWQEYSVVVAMAAAGATGDMTARAFRKRTYDLAKALVQGAPAAHPNKLGTDLNQGRVRVWGLSADGNPVSLIEVSRHGHVIGALGREEVDDGLRAAAQSIRVVEASWSNAAVILKSFAGEAPAHSRVAVWHQERAWTVVARWTTTDGPSDDDLAAVHREIRRTLGQTAWEP
jgi:schlafen family protein